jgi:hypothetical protein
MESSNGVGKKDFRKEITKLKKDLKTLFVLSKKVGETKNKSDEIQMLERSKLNQMKDEILGSMDNLSVLFMNRRKKVEGAADPGKNLVGFGKPSLVHKSLVDFLEKNFNLVNGKPFGQCFPILAEHNVGSRIQLQSLLNLLIRTKGARNKFDKRREQISVKTLVGLEELIKDANEILSIRSKEIIPLNESITSSDILKLLNAYVCRDCELTTEQKTILDQNKDAIRDENILAKKLLEDEKN